MNISQLTSYTNQASNLYVTCSSNDGKYIVVTTNTVNLYYSTNYGATFNTKVFTSSNIIRVCMSADGSVMYGIYSSGSNWYIQKSLDYGATWNNTGFPVKSGSQYVSISCNGDGTKVVAGVGHGYVYVSLNSGGSATERGTFAYYNTIDCSSSGIIYASAYPSGVKSQFRKSTNNGVDWSYFGRTEYCYGISCSSDGQKIIMLSFNNTTPQTFYVDISIDGGSTYTNVYTGAQVYSVNVSGNGTYMYFCTDSLIYYSSDSGENWTSILAPSYLGTSVKKIDSIYSGLKAYILGRFLGLLEQLTTSTSTIRGKAKIKNYKYKNISSKSRIKNFSTKTIKSRARLLSVSNTSKDIQSKANIDKSTTRISTVKANVWDEANGIAVLSNTEFPIKMKDNSN